MNLLPKLRKILRLPRLEYRSIMNQGDFLIEVSSEREDIPRVSCWCSPTPIHALPPLENSILQICACL